MVMTEEELEMWLDEEDAKARAAAAAQEARRKASCMPTFEAMKFDFKRALYAKAIGASL